MAAGRTNVNNWSRRALLSGFTGLFFAGSGRGAAAGDGWREDADRAIEEFGKLPARPSNVPSPSTALEKRLNEFILLDRMRAGVIWPGALLQGDSLLSAEYADIVVDAVDRKEIEITLAGLPIRDPSRKVPRPSHASVLTAINELRTSPMVGPAAPDLALTYHDFTDVEYGLFSIGVSASGVLASVKTELKRITASARSTLMIRVQCRDFTVSMEGTNRPSAPFASEDAFRLARSRTMGRGRPPLLVRTVCYGRELWIFVSSDQRFEQLRRSIEVDVKALGTGEHIDAKEIAARLLKDRKVGLYAIGGNVAGAGTLLVNPSVDKVAEYLEKNAAFDPRFTATAPVSFWAYYLADNTQAGIITSVTPKARPNVTLLGVSYTVNTSVELEAAGRLEISANVYGVAYPELRWDDAKVPKLGATEKSVVELLAKEFKPRGPFGILRQGAAAMDMRLLPGEKSCSGDHMLREPLPYSPDKPFAVHALVAARMGERNIDWTGSIIPTLIINDGGKIKRIALKESKPAEFKNNLLNDKRAEFVEEYRLPELDD
jgi:hypothetical protein